VDPSRRDSIRVDYSPSKDTTGEKALSPITTVASHVDPYPHWIMSGACVAGSYWTYARMANPRLAWLVGACGLGYAVAAQQIAMGKEKLGHDVATIASVGLLAVTGKKAWEGTEAHMTALGALATISGIGNITKSYQLRTGHPHDLKK
jgi:hypothetical protein